MNFKPLQSDMKNVNRDFLIIELIIRSLGTNWLTYSCPIPKQTRSGPIFFHAILRYHNKSYEGYIETLTFLRHENNLRMILEQLDPVFVEVEILYKSLETKLTHLSPFPIETITFLMLLQTRFLKKLAPAPLNPFVPSVTILYPLKISANLRFSDVFGGYRNVTLKKMGYVEILNESFE